MASRKPLNVLVYSGTGTTAESVRHCLYSLRRLLSPHFAVQSVSADVLLKEPWTSSTVLLVFPGGADLGYCKTFNGDGNRKISQYVRQGGAYLGFCAGGYYGTQMCEFEVGNGALEVTGRRELAFFPGIGRGAAFGGFEYGSERGARAAEIRVKGEEEYAFRTYINGGCVFVDAERMQDQGVEVLASYAEDLSVDGGAGKAAVVYCKVGEGHALLTGPHPEFAAVNLNRNTPEEGYADLVDALAAAEESRTKFLKSCLTKLGLSVPDSTNVPPLSDIHLSSLYPDAVGPLLDRLKDITTVSANGQSMITDEHDTFVLIPSSAASAFSTEFLSAALPQPPPFPDDSPTEKRVVTHLTTPPDASLTSHFSHSAFYTHLSTYRSSSRTDPTHFGSFLLYGSVVTSTNTLLDGNPSVLRRLPIGSTFTATTQVAGRGRGNNVWISPPGSLMFSTVLRHSMELNVTAPVVFVQYITALAIVEGIKSYAPGYEDVPVRLKWPNDVYVLDPSAIAQEKKTALGDGNGGNTDYVKVGGILVNSSYAENAFHLVVGVGLNTTNPAPTTSLNLVLDALNSLSSSSSSSPRPRRLEPFTPERLLARILVTFEELYYRFCLLGWAAFEELYYKHWLHSNQVVRLETQGGAKARVVGVTSDFGLLRVEELGWDGTATGRTWELQSDGNSFDFFRGLVKRKT